jgi:drug/metabolite transporter (DMT)-like permease
MTTPAAVAGHVDDAAKIPGRGMQRPGLVLVVVAWALTWPASEAALHAWPPLLLAGVRCLVSGALLIAATAVYGVRPWKIGTAQVVLVSGLLNVAVSIGASTYAVHYLSGGVASLLCYLQPAFLVLLAHRFLGEALRPRQLVAVAVGFAGVTIITVGASTQHASMAGVGIAVLGALSWGAGIAYLRGAQQRSVDTHLITRVAGPQFLVGGAILTLVGSTFEHWPAFPLTADAWWSTGLLTVSSAVGWLIYLALLEHGAETRRLGAWSFGVPLLANVIGVVFLQEAVSPLLIVGAAAVMLSIAANEWP